MQAPETRFAVLGEDRVAYQIFGSGPRTLVFTSGLWSHVDMMWEEPAMARALRRLSSFCRVIPFDRRGCGLSDKRPDDGGSIVDHWTQDLMAVMHAAEIQSAAILSTIDSGPLVLQFVDRHPQRCTELIFINTTAASREAPGYPQGHSPAVTEGIRKLFAEQWGHEEFAARSDPSQAGDPASLRWHAKFQRSLASPRAAGENLALLGEVDARHVLPKIRVPTLVITRTHVKLFSAAQARYMADHIPHARYVELPGADLQFVWEGADEIIGLIEEFITGQRRGGTAERKLATVLFTDMVDSTRRAAKIGDAAWRELLDRHDRVVRQEIERFGGKLMDSAGDGAFATFSTPGNAIDCAHTLHTALKELKIRIRAGIHIGEVELRDDGRVGGMAVHIGARVLGEAGAGEVMISRTVRDVLIGSHYKFKERGIHELKGVPSKWPLYAVDAPRKS